MYASFFLIYNRVFLEINDEVERDQEIDDPKADSPVVLFLLLCIFCF